MNADCSIRPNGRVFTECRNVVEHNAGGSEEGKLLTRPVVPARLPELTRKPKTATTSMVPFDIAAREAAA